MNQKFTFKRKSGSIIALSLLIVMISLFGNLTFAQTTIATGLTPNNGFGLVTFNFTNSNPNPILISDVASVSSGAAGASQTASVYYKTTPINGSPGAISAANGWVLAGTGTYTATGSTTAIQSFLNPNLQIPAGTTYGIAVESKTTATGTGTLRYNSQTAGGGNPTFTGGGCSLITGDNVAYAGDVAPTVPGNTPRGFSGTVTFSNVSTTPCSGTPAPGNTVSTASTVCPGIPFTLSAQNTVTGGGITYLWQSSPTGAAGSYTNLPGGTFTTYTVPTQSASTYYQVVVTCTNSGQSGISTPIQVLTTPASGCYCASTATNIADEDIGNVTLGTLNNTSTCASTGTGPGSTTRLYANYTTGTGAPAAPALVQGATMTLSVSAITCGTGNFTNSIAAWIDFNSNGAFEATERVMTSASAVGPHTETATFIVPANAVLGTTRMRVISDEIANSSTIPVCGTYTYGETEDYNVTIVPCVPSTVTLQPTAQSATCGGNATFTAAVSGSFPSYQWQVQTTTGGIWTDLTNTAPYSGVTTNTLTITGVTPAMSGYNYRLVYSNGCTGTSFTNAVALTVTPIAATFTQSPAALCAGGTTSQTITVTGGGTGVFTPNGPGSGLFTDAAHTVAYTGTAVTTVYAFPAATATYSYVRTNGGCVSNPATVTVTVNTALAGPAVLSATTAICANATGTISATGVVGTGLGYQWQVNSVAAPATFTNVPAAAPYSGTTSPTLTITNPTLAISGLKYQLVISSTSCATSITSNATTLTVNTVPVVTISASPNTTVTPVTPVVLTAAVSSATSPISYQWYLNNVSIPGATGQTYTVNANQPGDYSVTVRDANGCNAIGSAPLTITLSAGSSNVLFISPSPNNGVFNVRYFNSKATPTATEQAMLNVFDEKGSRVFTRFYTLTGPYTQMRVDMGSHGGGVYRVELSDAQGNRLQTGSVMVF